MNPILAKAGEAIIQRIDRVVPGYVTHSVTPQARLRATLRPGDILLVEGNRRISAIIKYLTQSTWSHAAMFVDDGPGRDLIEADVQDGVRYVGLAEYGQLNTRICRPVMLDPVDLAQVLDHMRASLGRTYDTRNIIDLMRYLVPAPVPRIWRRGALAFGSGDPTRAICSTLIAEAFQLVRYPILPEIRPSENAQAEREVLQIRHHSLFVPRDFDLSPYFQIVKPTIEVGFDYRSLHWYNEDTAASAVVVRDAPLHSFSRPSPPA
jgi:hypothetical protein